MKEKKIKQDARKNAGFTIFFYKIVTKKPLSPDMT